MSQLNKKRSILLIAGFLVVFLSLLTTNPLIGLLITILLSITVFFDDKMGIFYLLVFIPMRPFLSVMNEGYKWIGIFLIFALFIKCLVSLKWNLKRIFSVHYLEIFYILFCLFGAVVAYINQVSMSAIIMQLYTLLLFFIMFYIVRRMKINKEDIFLFSLTTLVTSTFISIHGLIEKLSNRTWLLPEVWREMELAPTNAVRIYGLIGGPNELGIYLVIAFIVSLLLLRYAKGKRTYLLYSCLVLIQTTFWLTYSRGVILTLIVFIPLLFLYYRSFPYWKQILSITAISLIFVAGISTSSLVLQRFTGAFSNETISLSQEDGRIYYVKKALEIFKDEPLTGYGLATFGSAATQTYSSPIYEQYNITWNFYSDNQYIQILAETGVIGLLLIFIFLIGICTIVWKARSDYKISILLFYLICCAVIGSLVYNMLENDIFTLYFYTTLGFAYQLLTKKIEPN